MDISEGGLLMESAGGVDVGHEVTLELMVPYVMRLLKVRARVVRKEAGDRIGVRILALSPNPARQSADSFNGESANKGRGGDSWSKLRKRVFV